MPTAAEKRSIVYCIVLLVLVLFALLYTMRSFAEPDFKPLYGSGRAVLSQHPIFGVQAVVPQNNSSHKDVHDVDRLHPPFEMIIYGSLALLNFRVAYLVWYVCNLVMLFSVPLLLWNYLPNLHRGFNYVLMLVATFFPAVVSLLQGQDSILLLLLLTICFICLSNHHEFRAGFALAMGMFKFVLIIPIFVALALTRRWRALAGFASGCLALLFVSLALVGWSGVLGYVRMMLGYTRVAPEEPGSEVVMPNLRGFLHSVAAGAVPESWLVIATLLVSLAILVFVDRRLAIGVVDPSELDLHFSTQVMLAAIVSYHLYPHDATILMLPMLLTLNRSAGEGFRNPLGWCFGIITAAMYFCFISPPRISMPIVFCACMVLLGGLNLSARNATTAAGWERQSETS